VPHGEENSLDIGKSIGIRVFGNLAVAVAITSVSLVASQPQLQRSPWSVSRSGVIERPR